jgi:methylated-DNA-[protein]-cysteine S-methyltransferase
MGSIVEKTGLGWIGVSGSARGIACVVLPQKTRQDVEARLKESRGNCSTDDAARLKDVASRLVKYINGQDIDFRDELDFSDATELQRKVWQETRRIPYGKTDTYGAVARRIGCRSPRAVGQALGKNPFPIIVPCHRVIGSNGKLVGFAGGLKQKEQLLKMEKATF